MQAPVLKTRARNILPGITATCAFFLLAEGILWIAGSQPLAVTEDRYVGFAQTSGLYRKKTDASGEAVLTTARNKLPWFNPQQFSIKKTEGAFRIFCLGGSTTYGRPYGDPTSFCGWLREFLPAADPSRNWEVINAGGVSYASYRLAVVMEELQHYEPDLFLVYSGHNEFLEARTYSKVMKIPAWLREADNIMGRTRLYSVLRHLSRLASGDKTPTRKNRPQLQGEVQTLLDGAIGPSAFSRNDAHRRHILEHYRSSLGRIIRLARAAGARVILITTPSNLKDCSPFKSEHSAGMDGKAQALVARRLAEGMQWERQKKYAQALKVYLAGAEADPRHAELAYRTGRALFALGRHRRAHGFFIRARDEDICPLRASTSIREIQMETARRSRVPLIDFEALLKRESVGKYGHSVLGEPYFLDHVHLSVDTHGMLALALLDKLAELNIVHPADTWDEHDVELVVRRVNNRIDNGTHGRALHKLAMVLNWAGKHEEAVRTAHSALGMDTVSREAAMSLIYVGTSLEREGRHADGIRHYCRALLVDGGNSQAFSLLVEALLYYSQALAALGRSPEASRHRAQAHQLIALNRIGKSNNGGDLGEILGEILATLSR